MNKIIINRGSFKLNEVVFEQGTTTIGRANDNTIVLDDTAVSSHHAKVVTLFHASYSEDLDSTNGTLVNGKPVQKRTLYSGDVISLGNHQLLFQSDKDASKKSETSDTVLLQGNEIKQKLNEFLQAQSDLEQHKVTAQTNENVRVTDQPASQAALSDPPLPAFAPLGGPSSLDRDKNQAWLNPKSKIPPTSPIADIKPEKSKPPTQISAADILPAAAADKSTPQAARNTAEALKSTAKPAASVTRATGEPAKASSEASATIGTGTHFSTNSAASPTSSSPKTPSRPQSTAIDIATAARAATQNRRQEDNAYLSDGVLALQTGKSRGRVMPLIWVIIGTVLIVEVVYIAFRTLA